MGRILGNHASTLVSITIAFFVTPMLQPSDATQTVVAGISVFMLVWVPWHLDTSYPRWVTGLALGGLFATQIAILFRYFPFFLMAAPIGGLSGMLAAKERPSSSPNPSVPHRRPTFSLAFVAVAICCFAIVLAVRQHQKRLLASDATNAILIADEWTGLRPRAAQLRMDFDSDGNYVVGSKTFEDEQDARAHVVGLLDLLREAGVPTERVSVTYNEDQRESNSLWVLLELAKGEAEFARRN